MCQFASFLIHANTGDVQVKNLLSHENTRADLDIPTDDPIHPERNWVDGHYLPTGEINCRDDKSLAALVKERWPTFTAFLTWALAKGADVTAKDNNGMTPLHWAAHYGQAKVAKVLLAKGADANAEDDDGMTPMHYAAYRGHAEVVKLLLAKGADANARDKNGMTPLHWAAHYGQAKVAKVLLAKGADVTAKASYGMTPLHWAARRGYAEIVTLLEAAIAKAKRVV